MRRSCQDRGTKPLVEARTKRSFVRAHVIIHQPYTFDTWIAYDQAGREIELEIVDW